MSMEFSEDILETARKIAADPATRRAVAKESFFWFFHIYFPHHIKYQNRFHSNAKLLTCFRMIQNRCLPLWPSWLWQVHHNHHGVRSVGDTRQTAENPAIIAGLTSSSATAAAFKTWKRELDSNKMLRNDPRSIPGGAGRVGLTFSCCYKLRRKDYCILNGTKHPRNASWTTPARYYSMR